MAELYVNVDGGMTPLSDCTWVFGYRCGHPFGVLLAQPDRGRSVPVSYATEEQAWRQFYPSARGRKAARERGVTATLRAFKAVKGDDEFWAWMQNGCDCAPGRNRRD